MSSDKAMGGDTGIVRLHFVTETALGRGPALLAQTPAQGLIEIVPDPRGAVVEKVLIGINDILFTQIPGQTPVKRGLLRCGEVQSVLPDGAPFALVTTEFPGRWRDAQLVIQNAAEEIAGEGDIADAGIEQAPVENQIGIAVAVHHPQRGVAEVVPDSVPDIDRDQVVIHLIEISRQANGLRIGDIRQHQPLHFLRCLHARTHCQPDEQHCQPSCEAGDAAGPEPQAGNATEISVDWSQ